MHIIIILSILLSFTAVAAQPETKVSIAGAGEAWLYPELGGHGIFLAAVDVSNLAGGMHFSAEFNTDTVRLNIGRIRFANGLFEFGAGIAGEAVFAGLLPDYFQKGKMDKERGFMAHYISANTYLKINLPKRNSVTLDVMGRKWFFKKNDDTHQSFVLPDEAMVFEPRLHYKFWRIKGDPSLSDRHRFFYRINGIAFGVTQKLELRSATSQWGAFDANTFDIPDDRNRPKNIASITVQWLKAGIQIAPWVRTQFAQTAMYGYGTDDLNRYRVGGMNPYVTPIAGAPWAAFVSDRFVAVEWSWHFVVFDETEAGFLLNGVYLDDMERTGRSDAGFQGGVAAFWDMRVGSYQLDVRAGWSPTMRWQSDAGQFSAFVAFGRAW